MCLKYPSINLRCVQEERLPFSRTDQCKRLLACKQVRVGQEMGEGGMVYQEIMLREIFQVESRIFCCQKISPSFVILKQMMQVFPHVVGTKCEVIKVQRSRSAKFRISFMEILGKGN